MSTSVRLLLAASALAGANMLLDHAAQAQTPARQPWTLSANQAAEMPSQFTAPVTASPAGRPGFVDAPMPNSDLYAPLPPTPKTAEVSPSLFQPRKTFRGDGYSYGSTVQSWQEQRLRPAPGVTVKVPLE